MPDKERKNNILFVDDEPNFLDGLRRMLHSQYSKWNMHFAVSVDDAVAELSNAKYDVIIADINMPGKNGFYFLELLNDSQNALNVPTVILTGINEQSLKRRALDMGAVDLLNKPIIKEDLIARIQSLLRLKTFQDGLKTDNEILKYRVDEQAVEIDRSRLEVVWRLARAAECRDKQTGNHIMRVGHYCRVISIELGMANDFVEMIGQTSPLHDIGKIGIPDEILLKPGKLTPDERKIMEQHCVIGSEILLREPKDIMFYGAYKKLNSHSELSESSNPLMQMASNIALSHHERWDGNGYPMGLLHENIPIESRITAVSDVYDALSFSRPYKPKFPDDKIFTIMEKESGHHFDPEVFSAYMRVINNIQSLKKQYTDE